MILQEILIRGTSDSVPLRHALPHEYTSFIPKESVIFPADDCVQNVLGFGGEE
jgi:hypothetical protein